MTCERGSHAQSKNCEILLFPTTDRRFDKKVNAPPGGPRFGPNSATELNASQSCPGIAWGGGGGGGCWQGGLDGFGID